ncbi:MULTISPECIES: HAMP domain-containing sensor histidine kinase [unclassified Sphingopyxis]|uniref:sensor histidine kinase n=1 Tax=unclassified Sphingopyxis TaxID=2614943 RepID=UPI000730C82E|nr:MULTISPECIES: HAMP domain-containing sensor histidine kinase [unclassified Sphingopyxis]KTE24348.1 histidine kinase [Sphingopyxis sp. H057]KTE50875.1 histidine kinase [Sphingopyxis sp. H071]KTE52019.1 histidine kinase [Sphingopyxis sp. H073]KTE59702.1 histidine kinase [Sphingopyxis sp. H107]KTE62219.1 histidine kinase [Sphingopyxis sp. H100]
MNERIVRGRVDSAGRLVSADAPLLRLQQRAGAAIGQPLALPNLARLVVLAQRLQRDISRPLYAADDHSDIHALVRVLPDGEGANLEISDWRTRPILLPEAPADGAGMASADGWTWECDQRLRLLTLHAEGDALPIPADWEGRSLSELFELQPDEQGRFPVLRALAGQSRFDGQRVRVETEQGTVTMTLAAEPLFDATGRLTGFRGVAVRGAADTDAGEYPAPPPDPAFGSLPLSDPQFGRRIDGALRGPLSRIIATAETIHGQFDGPIRADYARYAGDIAHAGRHLLGLVDDLADLQNIERPGFKAAADQIDLGDLARRAVGLLGMKAEEKGIRIDAPRVDDKMPATGEFRRVLQVLLNLLGNAIRYSPDNSQIWIRVDREGNRAMVTVADQGQGISAEQQDVVFEKFERLGRTDSGGSGLGLYIARRLARAMDGDLTVDSAPGQGARFTLSLPARD